MKKQTSVTKILVVSFLVDLSDVLLNVGISLISGSVTMISQALEGIADLIASGLLLWGNKKSKQAPDNEHPYGYGRETYLWAMLSGLIIFSITSTLSIYLGYQRLVNPEQIDNLGLAYFALIFAVFTNGYAFYLSYSRLKSKNKKVGIAKAFKNSTLIEVKTSFVQDLMGTAASIVGLIAMVIYGYTGNLIFDGIGAILTGVTLFIFSSMIMSSAKDLLIGRAASPATIVKIEEAVMSFNEVAKIVDLKTLNIGPNKLLINMEINVADNLTTDQLEKLIDAIEAKIKENITQTSFIQIELEDNP